MNFSPQILEENRRRNSALTTRYQPMLGVGCYGERIEVSTPVPGMETAFVPTTMVDDPLYPTVLNSPTQWQQLRCHHDFEYWCAAVVKIKDKLTGAPVPFILNAPQRRVLEVLEADRLANRPIRLIILKARQWGGSTLVQMYMAWIQSCLRRNWNSVICAHVKDTAATIRGMYTNMLRSYPPDLWEGDCAPEFKPFERSINVREIKGRGCRVTLASSENQDSVRGGDFAMAHLSETAFWSASRLHSPTEIIKSICGSIALQPLTLIAMESTANGVGNYFHNEWLRCEKGSGDKHAVFVPWYEIEIYRLPVADKDAQALWESLTPYELKLWEMGLTLEMIAWYHMKSAEYQSHDQMCAEYPTDSREAFLNTGSGVFALPLVEKLRENCAAPEYVGEIGAVQSHFGRIITRFCHDPKGQLSVWQHPKEGESYIVAVDIGGRSASSDWSVIAVFRRDFSSPHSPERPEVVAQWRGHTDHDLLAEKAMNISRHYNCALLVVESNTLETEVNTGQPDKYILGHIAASYPNTYYRNQGTGDERVGFHTNVATKGMIITNLISEVRDGTYIERSNEMCNELATYELTQRGSYAAKEGSHDDILMTRAIALHIMRRERRPIAMPHSTTSPRNWL